MPGVAAFYLGISGCQYGGCFGDVADLRVPSEDKMDTEEIMMLRSSGLGKNVRISGEKNELFTACQ